MFGMSVAVEDDTCGWAPLDVHASCKVVPDTDRLEVDGFLGAPLCDIQNLEDYSDDVRMKIGRVNKSAQSTTTGTVPSFDTSTA